MKAAILINPDSGNGTAPEMATILAHRLKERYTHIESAIIDDDGPVELARRLALEGADDVFVIGGDGTLNAVVEAFAPLERRPTIGMLPGGTNNTFARLLGAPADLAEAVATMPFNKRAHLDIGQLGDTYFAYYLAFGKLIEASMSTSSEEKELLGVLAYVKNILANIPSDACMPLKITVDDDVWEGSASHVYVINSTIFGNLTFSQLPGELNNGMAYVFILHDASLLSKVSAAASVLTGSAEENPYLHTMCGSRIHIEATNNQTVITDQDGQQGPALPVDIVIKKAHQPFFVTDDTPLL